MRIEEIRPLVVQVVSEELHKPQSGISDNTTLSELGANWLTLPNIIFLLEEKTGVLIPSPTVANFRFIRDIVAHLATSNNHIHVRA